MSSPAARRYAKALFMLGVEEKRLEALTREVQSLAEVVTSSPELQQVLANPVVAVQTRRAVMTDILARLSVSPTVRNAALLLTDRRRGALLPAIAEDLQRLADEQSGKLQAEVTSAAPLTEAQYAALTATLEKLTERKITLSRKTDPTLIGGVVTRIGDKVYDGSLKGRLEELRQSALPS